MSKTLADAVRQRLIEQGIAEARVQAGGFGLVGAATRRVELHVIQQSKPEE